MDWWVTGLIALCLAGVAVIGYGALRDRHKRQQRLAQLVNPPARFIPQLPADAESPTYLTRAQAHRNPPNPTPGAAGNDADTGDATAPHGLVDPGQLGRQLSAPGIRQVAVGYASADFVTDSAAGRAILDHPRILVSAEPIMAIRELIGPLEHMITDQSPIVIAAPAMDPEVLDTLQVNWIQRRLRVLVVLTRDPAPIDTICTTTGARLIGRFDLQSGYLADSDLGHCARWVSDSHTSYVMTPGHGAGTTPDQP